MLPPGRGSCAQQSHVFFTSPLTQSRKTKQPRDAPANSRGHCISQNSDPPLSRGINGLLRTFAFPPKLVVWKRQTWPEEARTDGTMQKLGYL